MSKYRKTIESKYYWIAKGQGQIFEMLNENISKRGDSAKLAKKIGSTPGYVSQILNGDSEINPTWKKIVKFCLALGKVPVLEIKDKEEFLMEQKMKASFRNYSNLFKEACLNISMEETKELDSVDHLELNEFMHVFLNKKKQSSNKESLFDNDFTEYEELVV